MSTLPTRPDLDQLRRQAKELLRAARSGDVGAADRLLAVSDRLTLSAAQLDVDRFLAACLHADQPAAQRQLDDGRVRADDLTHDDHAGLYRAAETGNCAALRAHGVPDEDPEI